MAPSSQMSKRLGNLRRSQIVSATIYVRVDVVVFWMSLEHGIMLRHLIGFYKNNCSIFIFIVQDVAGSDLRAKSVVCCILCCILCSVERQLTYKNRLYPTRFSVANSHRTACSNPVHQRQKNIGKNTKEQHDITEKKYIHKDPPRNCSPEIQVIIQ